MRVKRYSLIDHKGAYYVFWNRSIYGEPTFSRNPKDAKIMTAQGCSSAKRMLEDPKRWGAKVTRIELPSNS